ncbi:MAG: hypothetical protein M1347_01885 [Chloroflexi bacterium]|nr:hypothetical protein [Chloroflexota bacterium]
MYRLAHVAALILLSQLLTAANPSLAGAVEQVRTFTRSNEFDYVAWTLNAALVKLQQFSLGAERYLDGEAQSELLRDYMELVDQIQIGERQLGVLHSDPDQSRVANDIAALNRQLAKLYEQRRQSAHLAESILQAQVQSILDEYRLTVIGQPLPPILFHSTPLPWALIASPRTAIAQIANISLETELGLEDHIALEDEVSESLDLSTLVVPVGGIGTYPTMVAESSNLNWLAEVVSHEWAHNYLTLHPLGLLYLESPELQTMNETTANIVGKEISAALIARYYPELVPPEPLASSTLSAESPSAAPVFDFQKEMHGTRVHVDALLAEGKVEAAERYMEERRQLFWEQGYAIRKLNQAYFAFYGSYADVPIGPAGEDPVGAAVRELRARSSSLAEFVDRMSGLTSFDALRELLSSLNK